MKKNKKLFLAPALLLLVAVLAGCSQNDDALPAGTAVAQGGEPLNIRIAPKPGYAECANTRVTVNDETGAFAWETGDVIYLYVEFNDAAATKIRHKWTYAAGATAGYVADWNATSSWGTTGAAVTKLVWPLGASSAEVKAFYGEKGSSVENATGIIQLKYPGTGDYMEFSKTLSLGEGLTVDFAHGITRLVFTGLAASTAYSLKAAGVYVAIPRAWIVELSTSHVLTTGVYTSDASGNLTVCSDLDEKIDANGKLKLELVKDGETAGAYQTTLTAQGAAGAYKMDGYISKVKVDGTGGEVHPGNYNDLIKVPAPIVAGNIVYELNGFYVTIPDADVKKLYQWASSETATAMENNPCAGHGKWRLPTMEEFEKMSGWTTTNPWSQDPSLTEYSGNGFYGLPLGYWSNIPIWSSVVCTSPTTNVWCLEYIGAGQGRYKKLSKTSTAWVRCVQPK